MIIEYESSLEDMTEPVYRVHMKRVSWKTRIKPTVINVIITISIFLIIIRDDLRYALGCGLSFVIIFFIFNLYRYEARVKKVIQNRLKSNTEGKLSRVTKYSFMYDKLECDYLGATLGFKLKDLEHVTEDDEYMEISFGDVGLCTIPLRAFESEEQKETFTTMVSAHKK